MTTRITLVLGSLLLLSACSDPSGGVPPVTDARDTVGDSDAAVVDAAAEPIVDAAAAVVDASVAPPACTTAQLAAGDHDVSIQAGGRTRTYHLHVPPGLDGERAVPLLLNLHPLVLNGPGQAWFSGMNPVTDERGIIVAYPDGISGSWNGGSCCGTAAQQDVDDVGFIRAMVADIATRACVDLRRVYATGMSNGGYLSQRLGCEAADLVAAIAPAAGVIGIPHDDCHPSRPVPVLHFHGTADTLVDYADVAPTIATWADRNGCVDAPREIYRLGDVHCEVRDQCTQGARVILCTAEGGGHCWPGAASCPIGQAITDIDGNNYMLDFFAGYTLPDTSSP